MSVSNSVSGWSCSCDIELAFLEVNARDVVNALQEYIPEGYSIEDKSKIGWGCVISRDNEWVGDRRKLSDLICSFLEDIGNVLDKLRLIYDPKAPILRVGVYYQTYTLTIPISKNCLDVMGRKDVEFELSLYPSS